MLRKLLKAELLANEAERVCCLLLSLQRIWKSKHDRHIPRGMLNRASESEDSWNWTNKDNYTREEGKDNAVCKGELGQVGEGCMQPLRSAGWGGVGGCILNGAG